jgi:acetolactate synthase-1/3 small subunit
MRHTVVALLEDRPGALNRVVSLFRKRGFNIQSLTVGPTEIPELSRLTVVVDGDDAVLEQVAKQLYKVVDVVKVTDLTREPMVARELALIKVAATPQSRAEILQIAEIFRAKVVDVAPASLILEATGTEEKIDALIALVRPFGIKELVRTGRVAMIRGASTGRDEDPSPAPADKGRRLRAMP